MLSLQSHHITDLYVPYAGISFVIQSCLESRGLEKRKAEEMILAGYFQGLNVELK